MNALRVNPREPSAKIFISYRREDSAGHAGRLFDALSDPFGGRLFMDVDTLAPGTDFFEAIDEAVGSCEALIVIIGREWLTVEDKAGRRRLDDPGDFVRREIESALGRKIRVIPVLVQDAAMPGAGELPPSLGALARRHAIELSDDRWAYDVDRLARTIQVTLQENRDPAPRPERAEAGAETITLARAAVASPVSPGPIGRRVWLLSLAAAVLVAGIAVVALAASGRVSWGDDDRPPVLQGGPPAVASATGGVGIGASTTPAPAASAAPAANPAATGAPPSVEGTPVLNGMAPEGHPGEVAFPDEPASGVEVRPEREARPRTKVVQAATPTPAPVVTTHAGDDGPARATAADSPPPAPTPVPAPQPARVTIMSPHHCEIVGSDVVVQGVVYGLGEQQIFLGIRQGNGKVYPRGEIFPNTEGVWSINLRSSKERTFDILVVTSTSAAASRVLRDQRSRDDGLAVLPPGAVLGSGVVTLKKQNRIGGMLHPKRGDGDC